MNWVAALPMYNLCADLAADWQALLHELGERLQAQNRCQRLTILAGDALPLDTFWRRPDLLLSQTCGYPLMHGLAEHVHIVGVPVFNAPGCDGAYYRSAIVVRRAERAGSPGHRGGHRPGNRRRARRAKSLTIFDHLAVAISPAISSAMSAGSGASQR